MNATTGHSSLDSTPFARGASLDDGAHATFRRLRSRLNEEVLGQPELVDRLLICLLSDGHLLVEGAPGLAKTTAVKALADAIEGNDHRIQFTPDLLPADVTGTDVFQPENSSFRFERGPIFHNLVLADEINRAPAKVQSALLEAMAERQVTVGLHSYPLPEAQLDRFLMYVRVDYPDAETERQVLQLVRDRARGKASSDFVPATQESIFEARAEVLDIHLAPALEEYIAQLVIATRHPERYGDELAGLVEWGASPRGTIALDRCSRARAWLSQRDYVTPEDLHAIAPEVLRHRVLMTYEARAQGIDSDEFLRRLTQAVPLP